MIKKLAMGALLLTTLGAASSHAQTVFYSTYPAEDSGGPCIGTSGMVAVGTRNTSDTAYQIDRAKVKLHRVNPTVDVAFTVYSDDAGKPGSPIADLGLATGMQELPMYGDYVLTPPTPITFAPQTTYWIVASSPTTAEYCPTGWTMNASNPTGLLSFVASARTSEGTWGPIDYTVALELLGLPAPDAPLAAIATTGNGSVTLSWTPPNDNGSPITKYTVTGVPGGSCTTEIVAPATEPATSCTITGLTNGTPYKFTVVATNAIGDSAPSPESAEAIPLADVMFVGAGPNITLAGGVVAAAYSQPLQVTGGLPPYTFSVTGELPPGLALDTATGIISGTPTTTGTYGFSVMAMDSAVQPTLAAKAVHVAEQTFTIVITAAPVVQATPTPVPTLGGIGLLLLSGAVAGSMGLMRRRKSN